ncbi:MAG: dUTP diphosphatase [Lachnospiraceae bacterium]|nr:dUTP diphosphatase [Lachnospiraceae bacterium]
MEMCKVYFKKLDEKAIMPSYGSEYAAGADLYACMDGVVTVKPGMTEFIHTGIAIELPAYTVGLIYARSGLACKKGLAPANKVGVIDADYRGEIMVAIHNHSNNAVDIMPGDRVAQMVITPYIFGEYEEVEELSDTVRGAGGFGSTGDN